MIRNYSTLKSLLCLVVVLSGLRLTAQDPPDISLIFYLDENSPNGTLVGTVDATDPDGDVLTYSITSGNSAGGFAIGSSSGDITVLDVSVLDFEVTPSFSLMVEADDGNGGMTTASITINLNDIDENVLGIGEDPEIEVFPNPVIDLLSIEPGSAGIEKSDIVLYTLSGSKVVVPTYQGSGGRLEMDVRALRQGVYLLRIENRENPTTIRVFKKD